MSRGRCQLGRNRAQGIGRRVDIPSVTVARPATQCLNEPRRQTSSCPGGYCTDPEAVSGVQATASHQYQLPVILNETEDGW